MLSIRNIMTIFAAVLVERKVLLVSEQLSLLTLAGEAIRTLVFPFEWLYVYVPVLPETMLEFLQVGSRLRCGRLGGGVWRERW